MIGECSLPYSVLPYFSEDNPHFYDADMDSKFLVLINRGYNKIKVFIIISCLKTECEIFPEKYG